jgi:subfamily B ATP-binding cassette protein MsbA
VKEHFWRLMHYVRPYRWMVGVSILAGIVVSACTGGIAYAIRPLLDEVFINKDASTLAWLPWAVLGAFLAKTSASYLQSVYMQVLGNRVLRDIRDDLFKAMVGLPLVRHTQTSSGEYVSRMMNDVTVLQRAVSTVVKDLVRNSVTVVALIGVIFYQDWRLALVAVAVLPLAFYPLVRLSRGLRKRSRLGQEAVSDMTRVLTETLGGIRVVKAFGGEDREAARFARANNDYQRKLVRVARVSEVAGPMMELIGSAGIIGILIYGGHRVIAGETTPGAFFSFAGACMMVYSPARILTAANAVLQQSLAAAARIFEVIDLPQEGEAEGERLPALTEVREAVAFEHVSYAYSGEEGPALADVSLVARVGEVVALVGPSGAGKTTLANLLPRFIEPTSGVIRVDGVDIRERSLASVRALVGVVGQDTVLFDDTIAANIAYGAGDADCPRERIEEAAAKAHAHEFIQALPNGYDSRVGERGVMLSGGQRQRIAIARALLKDAPVLVLDEATSALDAESERHVQAALATLMEHRTTFVIAHRLATVRHAQQILVMDGGRIVERGTHEELLAESGLYRKLHDLQFRPAPQGAGGGA